MATTSSSASEFSLPLEGKLAIVTGASRGIGEGIAFELARRGASVAMAYTSPSSEPLVRALGERIRALPHRPPTYAVQADLSTTEGPIHLIRNLQQQWRAAAHTGDGQVHPQRPFQIDILVNNAGCEGVAAAPLGEIDVADYNAVYDVNVRGVLLLTQAALPHLSGQGARIVNIIGSAGARAAGFAGLGLYCSSKAALEALTRCWAAELGGSSNTTVNCVSPGPVQGGALLDKIPAEVVERQRAQTPVGNRLGTVEEVARVVAALVGRDGDWISGQVISASGGSSMY